jgi:hypothetical protein
MKSAVVCDMLNYINLSGSAKLRQSRSNPVALEFDGPYFKFDAVGCHVKIYGPQS